MTAHSVHRWSTRALLGAAAVLLAVVPVWGAIFTDINGLPAQRAIERVAAKGIIRGTPDGKFNPMGAVTRGEFAVSLMRALGLSTQGLALPNFKDAAEIPQDQRPAIALLTSLGSVSPQKVEIKKSTLVYTLSTNKAVYAPGDSLQIAFVIQNTGKDDVKFEFANSQLYDFIIRDSDGTEVAKWSLGRPFLPAPGPVTLAAGQQFRYETLWKQLDQSDDPVAAGRYEIIAVQTTKANPTSLSLFFNKGVMTAREDNTFGARQELSRLDLTLVTARAIGLADAAPSALTVTDAGDIPPAARGTVAAAISKGIVATVGDRAFRPAQRATRGELAQAVDVLMDTLNRYAFNKGTLKDPVAGTPPQITIEDERKALRTYRVARNNAVYRNNRPAELKDLRPGDVLRFLNVGEVGDVAYIEATGP